jgi:type IV secretory pathway VirB4 component
MAFGLSSQPLRDIDDEAEFGWGQEWVETLLRMQQVEVGPAERHTILQCAAGESVCGLDEFR